MNDPINPDHYRQGGIECIEVIEGLSYSIGTAIKYLWRYMDKANPIEDLEKALWYVRRSINHINMVRVPSFNYNLTENHLKHIKHKEIVDAILLLNRLKPDKAESEILKTLVILKANLARLKS